MGCGTVTSTFKHLVAKETSIRVEPFTEWISCSGLDFVRAVLRLRALTNQFQGQLAVQTAAVRTDKPDGWTALDIAVTADRCTSQEAIAQYTTAKLYCRFGIFYATSTGTATIEPETVTIAWGTDALDSFQSGDGERNTGELTLPVSGAPSIADKMWFQPGIAYSGTSAGASATATVITAIRS